MCHTHLDPDEAPAVSRPTCPVLHGQVLRNPPCSVPKRLSNAIRKPEPGETVRAHITTAPGQSLHAIHDNVRRGRVHGQPYQARLGFPGLAHQASPGRNMPGSNPRHSASTVSSEFSTVCDGSAGGFSPACSISTACSASSFEEACSFISSMILAR